LLAAAGARVVSTLHRDYPLDVEDWMERTATPDPVRTEIRTRFDAELDGGAPTGLRPYRTDDGTLMLTHTWAMTIAAPAR
jgi:hypothetical protein